MGDIVSMYSKNSFVGTWIDDGLHQNETRYETTIAAADGTLVIKSKAILSDGEVFTDNPNEELHCTLLQVTKSTLEYVSWYDSTGRRAYRTLTTTRDPNLLLVKVTYSDTTPTRKVANPHQEGGIYGTWRSDDDDNWSEYSFSKKAGQLKVTGFDICNQQEHIISNVQSGESWLSFDAMSPSDERYGELKFVFDETGTSAVMHFTFTEFYRRRRIG